MHERCEYQEVRNIHNERDNALKPIKWYKSLSTNRGRLEARAFLIEGDKTIRQMINNNPDAIIEIVSSEDFPPGYHGYPRRRVTESQLGAICTSKTPQGTVAVIRLPVEIYSDQLPDNTGNRILLLENVQDPRNVGSLIRTAVAFDYSGVILTMECADPLSPKSVQSSVGTVLSLWIRRTSHCSELVEELKHQEYTLVAADLNGEENPLVLQNRDKLLLALGNEASGLSASLLSASHSIVKIPIMREKVDSLNVAACGAICMYLSYDKH